MSFFSHGFSDNALCPFFHYNDTSLHDFFIFTIKLIELSVESSQFGIPELNVVGTVV